MKIERADHATVSFAMWRKDYGARGTVSLVKDMDTDEPMIKFQPAYNVGDKPPAPQLFRLVF